MRATRAVLVAAVITATIAATVGSAPATTSRGLSDPIPAPLRAGHLRGELRTVASGLVSPVTGTFAPGIPGRLFVADQIGKIWSIDIGRRGGSKSLFADLSSMVVKLGDIIPGTGYDERGLLGLAFSPGYQENGL